MGKRGPRAKPWTIYPEGGFAFINAVIADVRVRASLGIRFDARSASAKLFGQIERAAAEKFAELTNGRVLNAGAAQGARVLTAHTLTELIAMYLAECELTYPSSFKTRQTQLRNAKEWAEHATRFAKDKRTPIERLFGDDGAHLFAIDRLQQVVRETVHKETSVLFGFYAWAKNNHHLSELPRRPSLPRSAMGKRVGPQRAQPVEISHEEAIAICAAMPAYANRPSRKTGEPFVVRDYARFLYETGLRPGAVQHIQVPRDWMPGDTHLRVFAAEDKTRNGREVKLTTAALEILRRHATGKRGRVFDVHDLRSYFKAAALTVLPRDKAHAFARYDLRHGAASHGLTSSGGNLLGVAHQLGHRKITTTNRYLKPNVRAGDAVVDAVDDAARKRVSNSSVEPAEPLGGACAASDAKCGENRVVRRRGLEPLRFYSLAPQGSGLCKNTGNSDHDKRLSTSKTPRKTTVDPQNSSVTRQSPHFEALSELDRGVAFTNTIWDAFDAFTASATPDELDDAYDAIGATKR